MTSRAPPAMRRADSGLQKQKYGNHILDLRRSCKHGQYYKCQIEFIFPGKSQFPGSHNSQEVTLPRKSQFLGSNIFWEVAFLGNWQTNATHAFQQDPGRSHLLGSQISWEVTFQKKITFPSKSNFLKNKISSRNHISWKITFPKNHFPETHISREVSFPS